VDTSASGAAVDASEDKEGRAVREGNGAESIDNEATIGNADGNSSGCESAQ
jgi:hypothetical protein